MKTATPFLAFLLNLFLLITSLSSFACSMCKVTINGRTYLGNNEDSWRMGSRIWFENGHNGKLGSVYVGYGNNFPQGGMNEAGLAFDGLTTYPKPVKPGPAKKSILNPLDFVKEIMQTCKTVEDVRRYAIQYNRQQSFNNGEYLFADRYGNYLVMESDTILIGNDDKYIIANFCPSITPDNEKLKWDRYKRGSLFLSNHLNDTSENYCLALVDTMHECRKKLGDGTMYSFVADLQQGSFTLYFYHDYKHQVKFNLKEELAKGDHVLEMPALFPANNEFEKLKDYKTPQNDTAILSFLFFSGVLFAVSAVFFLVSYFAKGKHSAAISNPSSNIKLLLFSMNVMLLYYVIALVQNQAIFYFPAPYRDYQFSMLNIAAYIPFLMLILIVPISKMNIKLFKDSNWRIAAKWLFTLNSLTYITLLILFAYWGLYNIF